jgi:hypothetical protein
MTCYRLPTIRRATEDLLQLLRRDCHETCENQQDELPRWYLTDGLS